MHDHERIESEIHVESTDADTKEAENGILSQAERLSEIERLKSWLEEYAGCSVESDDFPRVMASIDHDEEAASNWFYYGTLRRIYRSYEMVEALGKSIEGLGTRDVNAILERVAHAAGIHTDRGGWEQKLETLLIADGKLEKSSI